MLSQALLSFTLEYEEESALSLALSADVVRVLSADGVPIRDLPARSGVSKDAITAAIGFLLALGLLDCALNALVALLLFCSGWPLRQRGCILARVEDVFRLQIS